MGSKLGTQKVAAAKAGLSLEAYQANLAAGLKRCRKCQTWKDAAADFGADRSRGDGRDVICGDCRIVGSGETPGKRIRAKMLKAGLKWCRVCRAWLDAGDVTKNGLCRPHENEETKKRYHSDEGFRERRKNNSNRQRRGVECVPIDGAESLTELFEGQCAYCPARAVAWDHVVPVTKGGTTIPGNMLPACTPCNSSKKDRDLDEWLTATGRELSYQAIEHLSLHGTLPVLDGVVHEERP